ncbi:phage portal protein [Rhodopila sp.]|uniref:phage portal protein n=1 Tax=Rhodopila sp. TaxID=2480087 RepID=UPI003D1453EB
MARGKSDSPGIATRVVEAARYVISEITPNAWLSPGQPLRPNAPAGTQPFRWDMPVGFNMQLSPKPRGRVSYAECRSLVENCDLLRIVIERRKDQIQSLPWQIGPRIDSKVTPNDPRIKLVENFFRYPDKDLDWNSWLRRLLDDLFVIDAVAIYKCRDMKGRLYSLDLLPGDTIALLGDSTGRRPPPPDPAYHQVHKGSIVNNFTTDELLYAARNVSTRDIYGYSPVRWIYTTVNTAIERAQTQLSHYTDGNLNKGIFWIDPSVSADQMSTLQSWWSSLMKGNNKARQEAAFLPGKPGSFQAIVDATLKDDFDEWLARIICFAFSVSPTPFVKQVNRATAESAQQAALEEGLGPLQSFIKGLIDRIIFQDFGFDDIEFQWKNDAEQDPQVAANIRKIDVSTGIISINEARADIGRDPIPGAADQLAIITAVGFMPLPSPESIQAQDDAKVAGSQAATDTAKNPPEPVNNPPPANDDKPVPDKEEGKPAKALGKKRSYTNPLDRAVAKTARAAIHKRVSTNLHHAAQHTAAQLRGMAIMRKADETDDERKARADKIADQLNFDFGDLNALSGPMSDVAVDAAGVALDNTGATMGTGLFGQVSQKSVSWAQDHAADLVTQITDSTRDKLRAVIADGLQDTDIHGIADRIAASAPFSDERALLIANTETAIASGQGALTGLHQARDLGIKIKKQWLDDPTACPICVGNAEDGPIDLDDVFSSGDSTVPAHPRCSCAITSIIED